MWGYDGRKNISTQIFRICINFLGDRCDSEPPAVLSDVPECEPPVASDVPGRGPQTEAQVPERGPQTESQVPERGPQTIQEVPKCSSISISSCATTQKVVTDVNNEVRELFGDGVLHHYLLCNASKCNDISQSEHARIKKTRNREKFNHSWLGKMDKETKLYWPVYIENDGFYCLLCARHHMKKNVKADKFVVESSVRIKEDSLDGHMKSAVHKQALQCEMTQRVSVFHKQVVEKEKMTDEAEFNGFYAIYWLIKHSIACTNSSSLLQLMQKCGASVFGYKHFGSFREIMITISDQILEEIITDIKEASTFSIMVDDVTDITSKEQCILFIQYYSVAHERTVVRFIDVTSLLDASDSTSADADTIFKVLLQVLRGNTLNGYFSKVYLFVSKHQ